MEKGEAVSTHGNAYLPHVIAMSHNCTVPYSHHSAIPCYLPYVLIWFLDETVVSFVSQIISFIIS